MPNREVDVRPLPKADKHPTIFAAYDDLRVGEAFVLVTDHDPRHLRDELEVDHAGAYGWDYLETGPRTWQVRISRLAATSLPRVLCTTTTVGEGTDASGAIWRLPMNTRDLDANIIQLPPDEVIGAHSGPTVDVLIHVLGGSGTLTTELDTLDLTPGALVWLPRHSRRQFTAGRDGLRYLTVHQRRKALALAPPARP